MNKVDTIVSTEEVIVMLRLRFRPGAVDQVLDELLPIAALTREEAGNIEFHVFRARDDDASLVLFERWVNQAALDRHWEQDYTKQVLALFEAQLARPLSQTEDVTYLSDTIGAAS